MSEMLNDIERRVIGVLLEKSLAQPQYYPMTLNAVVAACNQKSNRDPVMDLDEEAVWATLEALRTRGYVARVMPGTSGRVERFKHDVLQNLGWEKPQWAILAELLLRGPQTVGELRTHCARLYPFDSTEMVTVVLESLQERELPLVSMLPRGAGQSAVRYAHQLYPKDECERLVPAGTTAVPDDRPLAALTTVSTSRARDDDELERLREDVAELRREVVNLRQRVEQLKA